MGLVSQLRGPFIQAQFYNVEQTFENGKLGPPIEVEVGQPVKCKFYIDTINDLVIGEKLDVEIAGNLLIDPDSIDFAIEDNYTVEVQSTRYGVVFAEDIALRGNVLHVRLKRLRDGP